MMRLYFDTSVLGALTDKEDVRRLTETRKLFQSVADGVHEGIISNVVEEELQAAPSRLRESILREVRDIEFELIVEDAESRALLAEYLAMRIVPNRYRNDLRHVAVATKDYADALVSWNFRHLVNIRTRRAVHAVNLRFGYTLIDIISPQEV